MPRMVLFNPGFFCLVVLLYMLIPHVTGLNASSASPMRANSELESEQIYRQFKNVDELDSNTDIYHDVLPEVGYDYVTTVSSTLFAIFVVMIMIAFYLCILLFYTLGCKFFCHV